MTAESGQAASLTRRERDRARRRSDIIDAAQDLFFSRGFEKTTMNDIARMAELGKPTLYAYFKSKDEILFHVHMKGDELKMELLREAMRKGHNGYERLRAMGYAYFEFYQQNPEYLRIQANWDYRGYDFDRFGDGVGEAYRIWRMRFEELCRVYSDGVADGSLRGDLDVSRTVDFFFLTLRTIANQVILIRDPNATPLDSPDEGTYFDYLKLFLESIRARQ